MPALAFERQRLCQRKQAHTFSANETHLALTGRTFRRLDGTFGSFHTESGRNTLFGSKEAPINSKGTNALEDERPGQAELIRNTIEASCVQVDTINLRVMRLTKIAFYNAFTKNFR